MDYIDVRWRHTDQDDPVRLVSELGPDRSEVRKLEFFANGTVDSATRDCETTRTRLSIEPLPVLAEINRDSQFEAVALSASEFEALWAQHS